MKKLFLLVAIMAMVLPSCKKINEAIDDLDNRLDRLEQKAIPSIDEQIAAINVSLTLFDTVDKEFVALVSTLEESGTVSTERITTLKAKGAELYQQIANLRSYVDTELGSSTSWANATFATLEQHHILMAKLAEVKAVINVDISETAQALNNAIIALEISLQSWVGELILGYYTISEVDVRVMMLQNTIANVNGALQDELNELRNQLATTASEITDAYKKAIAEAIETNNGIINAKITAEVLALNTRITDEVSAINERLTAIEKRLSDVEGKVATIEQQITAINTSLDNLNAMDVELKGYIDGLTATAANLQEQINNTNTKVDEVKKTLEDEIANTASNMQNELAAAKADVIAQLEALRAEMETELAQINATIATLQAKDKEIENKIAALNTYVDNELGKTTDWVNATFATLEQYNALVVEIAVIKEQINATNQSIKSLETYLTSKISADIATAVSALNADIQQKVKDITDAYTNAIKTAKDEITAAYTTAIQTAINTLDASLKAWVGEQLANYYTIAQIDAMLAAMEKDMNGKLEAQKVYLVGLINELSASTSKSIAENKALIDGLQKDITNLQTTSAEHASRIAQNATTIATNTQNIIEISKSIYTNGSNIAENDKAIAENKVLIEANAKLIAENASEIEALKASPDASVVKNAAKIATNAENIAKNAELISANSTAIANNAAAIANNSADILQLRQDLTDTKAEITEAYKTAINDAITTNNGVIDAKIAAKVDAINTRIDNEVAIINASIKTLTDRMNALEVEMNTLKGMIADFLKEFDEIKETIEQILSMIQSVSYVPQYSDGRAIMPVVAGIYDGEVELDFQLSPKSVVSDIVANWQNILSVKAVYTKTRAVTYVDMPILSCVADGQNGIITVVASGRNLGEEFFKGNQAVNAALFISDGKNDKISDYVEVVPVNTTGDEIIPANEIWYTSVDGKIVAPNIPTSFNSVLLSNTYHSDKGILKFDADVTEIQAEAFKGCANFVSMTLPNTVVTVGDSAFEDCKGLHSILMSESLKEMGKTAFKYCTSLRSINIPNGITAIEEGTFSGCNKMLSVTIPDSITEIASSAFYECTSLASVNIFDLSAWCRIGFSSSSSNPLSNGADLYLNGALITELTIPSDVTEVKDYAFYNCKSLDNLTIHEGISAIGSSAFYGSNIISLFINSKAIEENLTDNSSGERWGAKFTNVIIGDNVTRIGSSCFKNHTSLSNITLPDSIVSIGNEAFYGCNALQGVIIPNNVTSLGKSAFYDCSGLRTMVIGSGVTSWGDYKIFSGCTGELIVNCNIRDAFSETVGSYTSSYTNYYSVFNGCKFTKVTIGDGVTSIGSMAFYHCTTLTDIIVSDSVTTIGSEAFSGCSNITNISLGNGITSIGNSMFSGCSKLTSVSLGNSISSLGSKAFYNCSKLLSVVIPESVTTIGSEAFYGCTSLIKINIPNSVTSIGSDTFYNCTGELIINNKERVERDYTSSSCPAYYSTSGGYKSSGWLYGAKFSKITIGDNVEKIGEYLFYNCSALTEVVIPNNVTTIGNYAFYKLTKLAQISMPESLTSIGASAFYQCGLIDVIIPKNVISIGNQAFYNCSKLQNVYCMPSTPPTGGSSMFYNNASERKIYVLTDSVDAYKSASNWSSYASYIEPYSVE